MSTTDHAADLAIAQAASPGSWEWSEFGTADLPILDTRTPDGGYLPEVIEVEHRLWGDGDCDTRLCISDSDKTFIAHFDPIKVQAMLNENQSLRDALAARDQEDHRG